MTRRNRLILGAAVAAAALWFMAAAARRSYVQPRAELLASIAAGESRVDGYRAGLRDHGRVNDEIRAVVDRTLGGDLETVDHRLRSRLNRLAELLSLHEVVVGTGRAVARETPAKRQFSRRDQALRDEIDFVELGAWITATGTLEQALQLAHAVQIEPWIKRIDQWRLDPDDAGEAITITLRFTTLFLPGREPATTAWPMYDGAGFARFATLVGVNPFRLPEAAPAPQPTPAPAAPPDPEAPLEQWTLTGIAEGPAGAEAWLAHAVTRESRTWRIGESLAAATLVSARGDEAIIEVNGAQFVIQVGRNLYDRSRPVR